MKLRHSIGLTLVCGALLLGQVSCGMSKTASSALIGGGGGGALGAGIGALLGGGKGAAIGAGVGAAVGAGVGALIGKKMDNQKKELEAQLADQANVESTTDANGLQAIKVTFDGGILFATNSATLSANAKTDLKRFAQSMEANPDTDAAIFGFTDNTGTLEVNQRVSTNRANAVKDYLEANGVAASRLQAEGKPMCDYVASNDTKAGQAQNRRVEIYIYASAEMIKKAQEGTLE